MRKEHVSACFRNMKLLDDWKQAALLHSEVDHKKRGLTNT